MSSKETKEINRAVNVFSEWMAKRMLHKERQGFSGWQEPQDYEVKERLLEKAEKIATADTPEHKDLIDVANFAMMIFMKEWSRTFPFNNE